eukprot:6712838-Prymnesium_polylepis.2
MAVVHGTGRWCGVAGAPHPALLCLVCTHAAAGGAPRRRARARRVGTQLEVDAVAQAQLLGGDGDAAVGAVEQEDGAGARPDDHPAVFAVGDLDLLARVEDVDVAVVAAIDFDADGEPRPAALARARRLQVRLRRSGGSSLVRQRRSATRRKGQTRRASVGSAPRRYGRPPRCPSLGGRACRQT